MVYSPASLVATGVIFTLLCSSSTALRFWARLSYTRGSLGLDDWLILVAAVIVCTLDTIQYISVKDNMHPDRPSDTIVADKLNYFQLIIEKIAYGCIKLSFLMFYRRIFGPWSLFRKANDILIAIVTTWAFAYMMAAIFACGIHPAAQWDGSSKPEKCYNLGSVLFSYAITDVITDLAVLSLPLTCIHRLQISRRKKWAVAGVFLLGFLSTLAGVLRLAFLSVYYELHQFDWNPPVLENPPSILRLISPTFWTNVELTCAVLAANLPPLWPLIRNTPSFGQFCASTHRRLSDSFHRHGSSVRLWVRRESTESITKISVVAGK